MAITIGPSATIKPRLSTVRSKTRAIYIKTNLAPAAAGRNIINATEHRNMKKIAFVLNLLWSLAGLFYSLLMLPRNIKKDKLQFVIVVRVKRLWINEIFLRRKVKGFVLGNTVLLSYAMQSIRKRSISAV